MEKVLSYKLQLLKLLELDTSKNKNKSNKKKNLGRSPS